MATLELCDLCNSKVKRQFTRVSIVGKVQLYEGNPPPPPEGFKYREDEDKAGVRLMKVWDEFGKYKGMVQYLDKPKKVKEVSISYDLCETCGQKLVGMLESLRRHYHLEEKEIAVLEQPKKFLLPDWSDEDDS